MAFRRSEQEQGVPSLGYRLSSNRQPGIEQSNNMMPQYSHPIDRGPRPGVLRMGNYQNMGRQSTDPRERYIANTQGGHPNMSKYGYPMQDRGPVTMSPIMAAVENPQVMSDLMYKYDLENQMDPNNFFTNRMAVGEQFGVDPFGDVIDDFGDINYPRISLEFGDEQAAVDPSDYRTILKMIEAGLNPDDYMAANRGGIASLMR